MTFHFPATKLVGLNSFNSGIKQFYVGLNSFNSGIKQF